MLKSKYWFLFLLFEFGAFFSSAQQTKLEPHDFEVFHRQYTIKDGLPSDQTYCVTEDNRGYVWISTDKGVSRFNGYEFENFTQEQGLIDNTIFWIKLATDGKIWFLGYNQRLCYWDWEKESFFHYKWNKELDDQLKRASSLDILDFMVDSKKSMHMSVRDFGYFVLDSLGKLTQEISFDSIRNFKNNEEYLNQANLFFGTKEIEGKDLDYGFRGLKSGFNSSCILIHNNSLFPAYHHTRKRNSGLLRSIPAGWISISNPRIPLSKLPPKNSIIKSMGYEEAIIKPLLTKHIGSYDEYKVWDQKGFTFVEVNSSIWVYKKNTKQFVKLLGRENMVFQSIYQGESWIALSTLADGVFIFNKDHITKISECSPSDYLPKGFVYKWDGTTNFLNYQPRQSLALKENEKVFKSNEFSGGRFEFDEWQRVKKMDVWAGGSRLLLGDGEYIVCDDFAADEVRAISSHRNGTVLLANTDKDYQIFHFNRRFFSNTIYQNKIILGSDIGLEQLQENGILIPFIENRKDEHFQNQRIQGLEVLGDTLIIGTRSAGVFFHYNDSTYLVRNMDSLPGSIINSISLKANRLCVSTNSGIASVKLTSGKALNWLLIDKAHGFPIGDITYTYENGKNIYAFGTNSFYEINLKSLEYSITSKPQIFTSGILVNGTAYGKDSLNPTFAYDRNNVEINYIGVSPEKYGQLKYRHKLEGLEKGWRITTKRNTEYRDLRPGDYCFKVQVRSIDGEWVDDMAIWSFKIKPPIWQTLWFYFLAFILLIIALYKVYSIRVARLKQKHRLIEEINSYKSKLVTAQLNPHFVFNSLNSIHHFILYEHKDKAERYLIKFSRLMRQVLEHSDKSLVPLEEELSSMKNYMDLEELRIKKGFDFQITIDPLIKSIHCLVQPLNIQPFLENAVWHGIAPLTDRRGVVSLLIKLEGNALKFTIKDNGVGQKTSFQSDGVKHHSYGGSLVKRRVELLNKRHKQQYHFQITNGINENGESCGTVVEFTVPYQTKNQI